MEGLIHYTRWLDSEDPQALTDAERCGQRLCEIQDGDTGAWRYEFDATVAGIGTMKAPWISALAQGKACSLLARLHRASSDPAYVSAACAALVPLERSVAAGGLCADLFGHPFYEEYPSSPSSFVLNGFEIALIGLFDLATTGEQHARILFDAGLETLVFALPFYDAKPTSAYHLGHITNPPRRLRSFEPYHEIHTTFLWALNSISPHDTLETYARRWTSYQH
jgi:heparosan-N-sulfate-glucuronate 5-epimerase